MNRIKELDGLRGIAIILVLTWHYLHCQLQPDHRQSLELLKALTSICWSGVDLFFVLSGFLIGGILIDNKDADNLLRVFYLKRVCRIFHLYYLMLFLFSMQLLFGYRASSVIPLWSFLTFSQNFLMGMKNTCGSAWLGITWSLAIEEQFYMLLPFIVKYHNMRSLVHIAFMCILISPFIRYLIPGLGSYVYTFARLDSIFVGVLLAAIVRNERLKVLIERNIVSFVNLFIISLFGVIILILKEPGIGQPFNHLFLALFYGLLTLIAVMKHKYSSFLKSHVLVYFGLRSYGIYLLHQAVSATLHGIIHKSPPQMLDAYTVGTTLAALIITLISAEISFRLYEGPFISFASRYSYSKSPNTINAFSLNMVL